MGLEGGLVAGPGNSRKRLKLKNKLKLRYKLKLKYKLEYKLKLRYKLTCRGDLPGRGESASVHFACLPEDHFYENKYGQNLTKTTSARCACLPEDHFDEKIFRQIWQFFFTNIYSLSLLSWKWLWWRRPGSWYCCLASTVENDKCYKKMFQVSSSGGCVWWLIVWHAIFS